MKIITTYSELLNRCNYWLKVCHELGIDEYICNEGGGHIEVTLTEEQAIHFGLIS